MVAGLSESRRLQNWANDLLRFKIEYYVTSYESLRSSKLKRRSSEDLRQIIQGTAIYGGS